MIQIKVPKNKFTENVYDPVQKKLIPSREKKKRIKKERLDRSVKHRGNMINAYPGYIFTVNRVPYLCYDAWDNPPEAPIPFPIYPMPKNRKKFLEELALQPRSEVTRWKANQLYGTYPHTHWTL